jgi:hypothetical protein
MSEPGATAQTGAQTHTQAAAEPGRGTVSILTDLHVPQIDWWAKRLQVLPPPKGHGLRPFFSSAWAMIKAGLGKDVIISANVRNSLAMGFVKRLFGLKRPRLMMVEMRLDDPPPGLRWRLKVALQRFSYATVDLMCVSARRERELYSQRLRVPIERFRFIPWHTNVLQPQRHAATQNVIFSAGRTGRDWPTLAKAVAGLSVPTIVVCSKSDAQRVSFPESVTVLTDIPYERYRELLSSARIVLIPLEPHVYSSGQVVILEAMALGKPVITTRVLGSEDYVEDGVNGLLVEPGDAEQLRAAIEKVLADPELEDRLARNALATVLERHTLDRYVNTIVGLAEQLGAHGTIDATVRAGE